MQHWQGSSHSQGCAAPSTHVSMLHFRCTRCLSGVPAVGFSSGLPCLKHLKLICLAAEVCFFFLRCEQFLWIHLDVIRKMFWVHGGCWQLLTCFLRPGHARQGMTHTRGWGCG